MMLDIKKSKEDTKHHKKFNTHFFCKIIALIYFSMSIKLISTTSLSIVIVII